MPLPPHPVAPAPALIWSWLAFARSALFSGLSPMLARPAPLYLPGVAPAARMRCGDGDALDPGRLPATSSSAPLGDRTDWPGRCAAAAAFGWTDAAIDMADWSASNRRTCAR
eukprot:365702-Chlamydomonas_euryale.AAC.33